MELSSTTKKILLGTGITLSIASLGYLFYKYTSKPAPEKPQSNKQTNNTPSKTTQQQPVNNTLSETTIQQPVNYVNDKLGVSFQHPPNWVVSILDNQPQLTILSLKPPKGGIPCHISIDIMIELGSYSLLVEEIGSPVDVKTYVYVSIQSVLEMYGNTALKLLSEKKLSQDTLEMVYDLKTPNDLTVRIWSVYVIKDLKAYLLQYVNTIDKFDSQTIKEIFASLKIK